MFRFLPHFAVLLSLVAGLAAAPGAMARGGVQHEAASDETQEPLRIVYHIGDGIDQAAAVVQNIRNQLRLRQDVAIVVVAVGPGIDFLIEEAQDKYANPFDATVQDLVSQGISFRICEMTMTTRGIGKDQILPEATIVTSGMNELARLQVQEGYAYIRP